MSIVEESPQVVSSIPHDYTKRLMVFGGRASMEQAARIDSAAGGGAPAPAAAGGTAERRTVPARLRTLNQLLEDGLITQDEFNELRRKILAEL